MLKADTHVSEEEVAKKDQGACEIGSQILTARSPSSSLEQALCSHGRVALDQGNSAELDYQ